MAWLVLSVKLKIKSHFICNSKLLMSKDGSFLGEVTILTCAAISFMGLTSRASYGYKVTKRLTPASNYQADLL